MDNSIKTLDQVTISKKSNNYLSKTKFSDSLDQTLKNRNHMIYFITIALHTFGNYLYFEAGDNIKKLNLEELYQLLVNLQKKYYANSDILANINYICGSIIKNIKDKIYIE
jgi:predicted RND superfamily exporter protein